MSKMVAIRCTLAHMLVRFDILAKMKLNAGHIASVMVNQDVLLRSIVTNSIYVEIVAERDAVDTQQLQNVQQDAPVMVKYI